MIVVDSSAAIAIAQREPEAKAFLDAIYAADAAFISAVNLVETSMVLEGRYKAAGRALFNSQMAQLAALGLALHAVDERQAQWAREAFRRFGKGRHAAALNLGDCFAYALARSLDAPLLFKGGDFARTDVKRL